MIPLPTKRGRDGGEIMIPLPSRSRDLIFSAVDVMRTLRGRIGFSASALGDQLPSVAFKARRSVALPTSARGAARYPEDTGSRERAGSGIMIPPPMSMGAR